MYTTIVILLILVSILMSLIVLIQESKGGGLAADYSTGNTVLGAPKTTNFIEKATWTLAGLMVLLSVASVKCLPTASDDDSVMDNAAIPTVPAAPANTTQQGPTAPATPAAE